MQNNLLRKISLLLLLVLALTACGGPPKQVEQDIDRLEQTLQEARTTVESTTSEYAQLLESSDYTFLREKYSPEERKEGAFPEAGRMIDEAEKVRTEKIPAIVKDYSDERQGELTGAINQVKELAKSATDKAKEPSVWASEVLGVREGFDEKSAVALKQAATTEKAFDTLSTDVEDAKRQYGQQADAIGRRFQPFVDWNATTEKNRQVLESESEKQNPDYLIAATAIHEIENASSQLNEASEQFRGEIGQLAFSETHTLMDIKVDTDLGISRTSWDNDSDGNTEEEYDYPSKRVDQDVANHFSQFGPDQSLARFTTGWGGGFETESTVDRVQWDKLGINPEENWPSRSDTAEFYVGELEDTYCHKVMVLRDGKPHMDGRPNTADNYCSQYDTDADLAKGVYWVESDELRSEDIGMDVYSKASGDFIDQASEEATPPGMSYVGNEQYGQWQNDSNGNSFWVFYGQYRLFSDLIGGSNPHHYRHEYNDWNRNYRYAGRPYYGKDGDRDRYGANSTLASVRFPNSSYQKSGLQDATVRNAGPVARGGGPGGGGK